MASAVTWHGRCPRTFGALRRPSRGPGEVPRPMARGPRIARDRSHQECDMPLMNVVITLIVVGVLLWLVNSYVPMDAKIKRILNIVVVIAVVLWLLSAFGLIGNLGHVRVGPH